MLLLNFTHPLTAAQLEQAAAAAGQAAEQILSTMIHFDPAQPLAPQIRAQIEELGVAPDGWQTQPILVNLPGHAAAAACVLAELHGRMGYFPAILHIRPRPEGVVTQYEVAEIINLQALREQARQRRHAPLKEPHGLATEPE